MLRIVVPGPPTAKARPRVVRRGDKLVAITPDKTVRYENLMAYCAQQAMGEAPLLEGPLAVTIFAHFGIPKSWSKKRRAAHAEKPEYHTGRPDWDNIGKTVDGLNGVVWRDDAQVAQAQVVKLYGDIPQVIIEVRQL